MSLVHLSHVCSHLQNASLARLGLTSIPYTKLHLQVALLLQRQGFFSTVDIAGADPPLSRLPHSIQTSQARLSERTAAPPRERLLARLVRMRTELEQQASKPYNEWTTNDVRHFVDQKASLKGSGDKHVEEDIEWALSQAQRSAHDILQNGVKVEAMGLTIDNQPLDADSRTIDTAEGIITQENRASRRLWLGLKYWNGEPVLQKAKMISKPSKRLWLNTPDLARVVRGTQAGEVRGMTKIGEVMAVSTDKGIMEARECVERRIGGQPLARFY